MSFASPLTGILFSSLFLTYLLSYLSFPLRIDALRFQARGRKRLFSFFSLLWPPWVADADIIFLSCGFFYLFFLAYSQPSQIECLPYFHTWCGLSVNLGCKSEMCCMRLAENTGRKKLPKIRHLSTTAQLCRTLSSQLRHVLTIRKKTC